MSEDRNLDILSKGLDKQIVKQQVKEGVAGVAEDVVDAISGARDTVVRQVDKSGVFDTTSKGWKEAGTDLGKGAKEVFVDPVVDKFKDLTGISEKENREYAEELQRQSDKARAPIEAKERTERRQKISSIAQKAFPLPAAGEPDRLKGTREWIESLGSEGQATLYSRVGQLVDGDLRIVRELSIGSGQTEFDIYDAESHRLEQEIVKNKKDMSEASRMPSDREALNQGWHDLQAESASAIKGKLVELEKEISGRLLTQEEYVMAQIPALEAIQKAWHAANINPMDEESRPARELLRQIYFANRDRLQINTEGAEPISGGFFNDACEIVAENGNRNPEYMNRIISEIQSVAQASAYDGLEGADSQRAQRLVFNLVDKGLVTLRTSN